MDFTREPIIETVITPKEGCKLVVRSSKSAGQEEYFVDAVEVVSFGSSFFFRSLERPKSFLVPASDYEIMEVRETRMVLKNVGLDRSIKIGGGREGAIKPPKEAVSEKIEQPAEEALIPLAEGIPLPEVKTDARLDKKRDRRSRYRRRRGREESVTKEGETSVEMPEEIKIELQAPQKEEEQVAGQPMTSSPTLLSSILPPPPTLISETIARYKDNAMFKGAFFMKEEESLEEEEKGISIPIEEPHLNPFDISVEDEDEICRNHATSFSLEEEPLQNELETPSESAEGHADTANNSKPIP